MHINSFAPELSAAFNLVCGCIIYAPSLLSLFDDLGNAPIFVLAQLSGLDDKDLIAYAAGVGLVVRLKSLGFLNGLFIERVFAFFFDGDLLLLDEPFTGLDADNARLVLDEILRQKANRPVLMITHDHDWDSYADRVIRLDEAKD